MSAIERMLAIGIVFLIAVKVMAAKQESFATLPSPHETNSDRVFENAERLHVQHRRLMQAAKHACGANTRTEIAAWEKRNARLLKDAQIISWAPPPARPRGVWRADGHGTRTVFCAQLAKQLVAGDYDLSDEAGAELSALARQKQLR